MKKIFENIVFKHQKQVACIGVLLSGKNEWKISVIRAKRAGDEIRIVDAAENLKDLTEASKLVSRNIPVILHLDGWGVLIKDYKGVNGAIPIDNKEFFLKEFAGMNEGGTYFSIVRVDLLKSIIDECSCASMDVIAISAGPSNVALLSPYFKENQELITGKWKIILNKGNIISCDATGHEIQTQYNLGGESITSGLLPLFADVVSFFSGDRESDVLIDTYREEYVYGRLIKYITALSLSSMLFLLLFNFILWNSLRNRNNELTSRATRNEHLLAMLEEKSKELKEKKMLVIHYIGSSERTHYAWYADQLCSILPSGLRLTMMAVQPLTRKPKPYIPIEYKTRSIAIEGDANHMAEISDWMDRIKKEEWVKKVELISFYADDEKAQGHFKLQINY